jgi:hypothetical protein
MSDCRCPRHSLLCLIAPCMHESMVCSIGALRSVAVRLTG